jgi:hypothetical protein
MRLGSLEPANMANRCARFWSSITVVRTDTGAIVTTIPADASNRLSDPTQAAFDEERILVTKYSSDSVTLSFWITLSSTNQLVRF